MSSPNARRASSVAALCSARSRGGRGCPFPGVERRFYRATLRNVRAAFPHVQDKPVATYRCRETLRLYFSKQVLSSHSGTSAPASYLAWSRAKRASSHNVSAIPFFAPASRKRIVCSISIRASPVVTLQCGAEDCYRLATRVRPPPGFRNRRIRRRQRPSEPAMLGEKAI